MPIKPAVSTDDPKLSMLKNRSVLRIAVAQFLAVAATYAIFFSSIAFVEKRTQSSAQMGVMIFAITLPGYMVGMLAGVFVDRYDRRKSLVIASLVSLVIGAAFALGTYRFEELTPLLVVVYCCNFVLSACVQFSASARDSLLPNAVESEQLFAANSIIQVAFIAAQGLGTVMLSPILLKMGGTPAVGLATLPLFALAALAYVGIPKHVGAQASKRSVKTFSNLWSELKDGWRYITSDSKLSHAIAYLVLVSSLILVFSTLLPGIASRVWGIAIENVMIIAVPGGLGFAFGLWLVGRQGHLLKVEQWVSVGLLTLGGGLALISLLRELRGFSVLLFLLISGVTGTGFALVIIATRTFIQAHTPDKLRGRVMSTQMFLCNTASTLPLPIMGGLADAVGFKTIFVLLGFTVIGAGVISARTARREEEVKWA
jgi:DHA3 family macrolide efflux protein-like MFS transporter